MNGFSWTSPETRIFDFAEPFALECGGELTAPRVAYRTWGRLNRAGDNAVLVCHALTGSADLDRWWPDLLGEGRALDPTRDFVVCSNVLGSCYGTTGPTSEGRPGGGAWRSAFPEITIRDMVHLQARLLESQGVRRLDLVVGGSMGGMQVLEWGALYPGRVRALAPIAVSARHSPWCIALSEAQRAAIEVDPCYQEGEYEPERPPSEGLAVARMIAMASYRSWEGFEGRFGRRKAGSGAFDVERYLRHQGVKLVKRFDANAYVTLTRAMDRHDLGRGRVSCTEALRAIGHPVLVIAIDSDVLYPPREQEELAARLPRGELAVIRSPHGHDAFLIEGAAVGNLIAGFRRRLCQWAVA